MPKPWDAPPLPSVGDLDPCLTFQGVGRIMTAWEQIEFQLCILHADFCDDPQGEAMRLYGEKRSLPGRLDDFGKAAASYFMRNPNQAKEGALYNLIEEVRGYVDRRNEVAHGRVLKISDIEFFRRHLKDKNRTPPQYAVVPPYYAKQWHASDGLPSYAYTAQSLAKLEKKMLDLLIRLNDYEHSL